MTSNDETREQWSRRLRRASAVLSAVVIAIGAVVLGGWLFDVSWIKRFHPSFVAMKANTAVAFMVLGVGLGLARAGSRPRLRRACGLLVALLGALTLAEYLLDLNVGIDQLLFREEPPPRFPGRMAPLTALTFVILGTAVAAPERGRWLGWKQVASLLVATGSFVAVCGYLYGASSLYAIGWYSAIALHTALLSIVACCALLFARPWEGVMRVVSGGTPAGHLLRRLLPLFVVAPMAIGWLRLQGEKRGYYDAAFGVALMVLSNVILVVIFTWRFAQRLDRSEAHLLAAFAEITSLNKGLERRVEQRTKELEHAKERLDGIIALAADAIISVDASGHVVIFNNGAEEIFGWTRAEIMGQPLELLLPQRFREGHRHHVASFASERTVARKMLERDRIFGLRRNGEEFPAEAAISKLETDAGYLFTVILRDVSARVRFEEERQVFFALLENSSDFIGIADPQGKPLYLNPAGRRMVGLPPDLPIEQVTIPECYPPEHRAFATDVILKSMLEHGRWSGETYFRNFMTEEAIPVSDEHFLIRDRGGGRVLGMGTVTRDISEARRASDRLKESEERFRLTIDEAPIGMALVALDGRFIRVNRALCEIVGYSAEELTERRFQDISAPEGLDREIDLAVKLARGEIQRYQLERCYIRKDGRSVQVMLSAALVRGSDGGARYGIFQIEDISERKQAEAALRVSEEFLSLAVEAADQGLWDWNVVTDEAHLSPRYWSLVRRSEGEHRPNFEFFKSLVHPDDLSVVEQAIRDHLEGKSARAVLEYRLANGPGDEVWLRNTGRVVARDQEGRAVRMAGVVTDITGEKRLAEERARNLKEKETLLKEIHHRVKNNLQILSSLFYLQRQRTDQESLRVLLDESRNRIRSIALIHEKLYQSEHLVGIDFEDYLNDLTRGLLGAMGSGGNQARIVVRAAGVALDIDHAIPCALIVNELVSNSLKHAFPGGRSGEIRIELGWMSPDRLRLAVSDTGVGFPAELDFTKTRSLGMQLVCSLTTQLRGAVRLARDRGTRFEIDFPFARQPAAEEMAQGPS